MGNYIPSTAGERQAMLQAIGFESMEALFKAQIPEKILLDRPLDLPSGLSEREVRSVMEAIAAKNHVFRTIFRGAGAYNHYIPSIVKSVVSNETLLTAYTPYQAEISQGILQSIFEYQTMICELTGMDASNASVYDGASAAAEATAMCRERKRTKVLVSATANPQVIRTIRTYNWGVNATVTLVPAKDGVTDWAALERLADGETACVYVQHPNYYGMLEDVDTAARLTHQAGAKLIMGVHPIAQAILKTPADYGADIVVGEGQPLGMPLSFGGPYLGFMACKQDMVRKLPGRIVGETTDKEGQRAFVLTLQAREQHIRREKASSSLCSNEALCALTAAVYMSAMGPEGMAEAARQSMSKAHEAAKKISAIPGFEMKFSGAFFHEFVTQCPIPTDELTERLECEDMLGGYPLQGELSGCILWCCTEMNTQSEIDRLAKVLEEVAEQWN